jgi:hypothetical protein
VLYGQSITYFTAWLVEKSGKAGAVIAGAGHHVGEHLGDPG